MFNRALGIFATANFRRLYIGDLLTFLSFWLCYINMGWLTYDLTKSSLALGILGFVTNLPVLFFMPLSGVMADRIDKRKIIVFVQIFYFLPTLALIWQGWHDAYTYTMLLITAFAFGLIFTCSFPAASSYASELVASEDIQKAVSLVRTNSRTTMVLSSTLNGLLHLVVSFTGTFMASFLLYAGGLVAFFRIKKSPVKREPVATHIITQLKEGFSHVFKFAPLWSTIALAATATNLGNAYTYQLPTFAAQSLSGNIHTLSYLYIASGLGAVLAAVYLALLPQAQHLMKKACAALIVFGISFFIFGHSHTLILSLSVAVLIGFCEIFVNGVCAATLQAITDEDKRGRVMSCFGFIVLGFIPFSNLAMGGLGFWFSPGAALSIFGAFCIIIAFWYFTRIKHFKVLLQTIYQQKNIDSQNQPI